MNVLKKILGVLILVYLVNCQPNADERDFKISLVNLGNLNSFRIEFVQNTLENKFKIDTIINSNQELPEETYYAPRNRYRADKLIKFLKENYKTERVIGVTDKDISTTSGKHEDWGIMGLAYRPGKSCVVSTFRTFKNAKSETHENERLQKVVVHEFGHTLGLPHCENSKTCVMRDATGKVSTIDEVNDFCSKCRNEIKKYLKD